MGEYALKSDRCATPRTRLYMANETGRTATDRGVPAAQSGLVSLVRGSTLREYTCLDPQLLNLRQYSPSLSFTSLSLAAACSPYAPGSIHSSSNLLTKQCGSPHLLLTGRWTNVKSSTSPAGAPLSHVQISRRMLSEAVVGFGMRRSVGWAGAVRTVVKGDVLKPSCSNYPWWYANSVHGLS